MSVHSSALRLQPIGSALRANVVRGDVVFVHGFGGDPRETWRANGASSAWPEWLADARRDLAFHTLTWPVAGNDWLSVTDALTTLASAAAAYLCANGLGGRPVCFVTHSMGGLLVKQMLRDPSPAAQAIAERTRGVVFVATPHLGSGFANVIRRIPILSSAIALVELERDRQSLSALNDWYRTWVADGSCLHLVYHEARRTRKWLLPWPSILVVPRESADPGIAKVIATSIDADHIEIVKPADPEHRLVKEVRILLDSVLPSLSAEPQAAAAESAESLLPSLPLDVVPAPGQLPPGSQFALRGLHPNPLFVGRDDDLRVLARNMNQGRSIVVTTGIGGVGKTQLAIEFAFRYGQFFPGGVFWISMERADAIASQVAACGGPGAMELRPDFGDLKQDDQVSLVRAAWNDRTPRLVVFDNCEEESLLREWWPAPGGGCRVLVTSRRPAWDPTLGVTPYALDILAPEASVALLRGFRPDLASDDPDLAAIATELDHLPLALHLAGSYLRDRQYDMSPAQVLRELRQPQMMEHPALARSGKTPTGREAHVWRTFALGFDRLNSADQIDVDAKALLARAACLAPGELIPRELLVVSLVGEGPDAVDRSRAEDAARRLVDLGQMEGGGGGGFRLHRLLAAFARSVADDASARPAVDRAVLGMARELNATGDPRRAESILPHLRFVTDAALARDDVSAGDLCGSLDYLLDARGDYAGARLYSERALAIREKALGPEHPDTATSLNNLALLLQAQGDFAAARPLYERALAINEKVLGPEHPDTATSLNNLAGLLRAQGDFAAARPLYERALAIREKALGPEHPDTATSLNNLALLLRAQGDFAAARPLLERAITVLDRIDARSSGLAVSLFGLALIVRAEGDLARASSLLERAIEIDEAAYGPDHLEVATDLEALAPIVEELGDRARAQKLRERAARIRARSAGSKEGGE
ncbi:MAG: tetratricopeptide repeat protein [Chloroflexota bacterium]|nr:MAG: tetratricopeptide repeat protein [Chloroflexota bacterium]